MPRSARDPLAAYLLIQAGLLRRRDLPQSDERLTTRDRAVTCGQSWRPGQRPRDLRAATPAGPGRASKPPADAARAPRLVRSVEALALSTAQVAEPQPAAVGDHSSPS
jgi:hypothetical protein